MPTYYTKERFWEIFQKLPEELKEAVMSEKTAESIFDACLNYGVDDERISEVARYAGRVLMGLIPPEDFQKTLEKELKLKKDSAKGITRDINRFVFYPVKPVLDQINKIGSSEEKSQEKKMVEKTEKKETKEEKEKPVVSSQKDTYREPIE